LENERKPLSYEELMALVKKSKEPKPFASWIYYNDGTVWTNAYTEGLELKKTEETWKEEEPSQPSKPVPIQLTCKRCGRSWNQRGKRKPMQCPKCKSPYWNKKRKKT
jgi:predicted Zn-ribbon and HTH transcriptional regulator